MKLLKQQDSLGYYAKLYRSWTTYEQHVFFTTITHFPSSDISHAARAQRTWGTFDQVMDRRKTVNDNRYPSNVVFFYLPLKHLD